MQGISRGYRLTLTAAALILLSLWSAPAEGQTAEQDKLEAAMTVQLLSFVEWPAAARADPSDPIVIGVFARPDLLASFEALFQSGSYQGRFEARPVRASASDSDLEALDALFFGEDSPREVPRMIRRLSNRPVVLIGSFEGFLEMGGMVNFTVRHKRLGFEINIAASSQHEIQYRSKLLRLATRIVGE